MKIEIYNIEGQKTGKTVQLNDAVFNIEPNDHAIYLSVKHYMASKRSGNHKSKERGEITGSTKKIKRQKGTGTARAGSIKSPVFRGGGRVFGPRPHSYSFKLNKKVSRLARKSALSAKLKDGELMVVEDFKLEQVKTKAFVDILQKWGTQTLKSMIVVPDVDQNLHLSSRNFALAKVKRADSINTYEILDNKKLILSESAIGIIEEILTK
jgi:large subunit ribosomal protein L4